MAMQPAVPPAPVAGLHDFKLHHHHDPEKASPAGSVTYGRAVELVVVGMAMQRGNQGAWAAESSFFEVAEDDWWHDLLLRSHALTPYDTQLYTRLARLLLRLL
jgi:hypothetical protein